MQFLDEILQSFHYISYLIFIILLTFRPVKQYFDIFLRFFNFFIVILNYPQSYL